MKIWIGYRITMGICSQPLVAAATRKRCREVLNETFPLVNARWTEPEEDGSILRLDSAPFVFHKIIKLKLS